VDENFSLRYTSIPFTVLYADGRFQQEQIGQIANEADTTGAYSFGRNTESTGDLKEFRAGFNVSPTARLGFTGHYKHRVKETTYEHLRDLGPFNTPGFGYSAFLLGRKITTDEIEGKVTFRATRWMNLTLGYRHLDGDYDTTTDSVPGAAQGGSIHSGNTTTDNFSLGVTLTPWQRLYLNTTFSFEPSKTWTDHNSLPVVADYKGDVYNVVSSGTLVLSEKTDWTLSYSFSRSDYSQSPTQTAIPLGAVYDWHGVQTGLHHRFSKQVSGSIQYSYYLFNDISNARVGDFSAHGIMTALTYRLP
jgi:hypothetical protein